MFKIIQGHQFQY